MFNMSFDSCSENKRHDVGDLSFLSYSKCHCTTQPYKQQGMQSSLGHFSFKLWGYRVEPCV
jgi:hypothetical protein